MATKELTKKELEQKLAELERENQELRQAKQTKKSKTTSERIADVADKVEKNEHKCSQEHLRRIAQDPSMSDDQVVKGTVNKDGLQPKTSSAQSARRWFVEVIGVLKACGYTVGDY